MKSLLCKSLVVGFLITLSLGTPAFSADGLAEVGRMVYGDNPLKPSPESLLGKYLAETNERHFTRTFPYGPNGSAGPERLVVFVSELTFPIFQKYFTGTNFLYQFHEPHAHSFYAAFKDKRGTMGRLQDGFRYNYAGVLAIPILLTKEEGKRAEQFFNLALKVKRKNDIALFPWRLTSADGLPYCAVACEKSIADWFVRMPIGKSSENKNVNSYDVCRITPDIVQNGVQPEQVQLDIQNVWCAPQGRESLAETIGLPELEKLGDDLTPGKTGAVLLGQASIERVPVVFRFTDSVPEKPVPEDFDTYFDLEFNPNSDCNQ